MLSSKLSPTIALPKETRCSYQSKFCNNHRAVKPNGDLHKLCEFHRKKANLNQKRMQQRRRLLRKQATIMAINCTTLDEITPITNLTSSSFCVEFPTSSIACIDELLEPFAGPCDGFSHEDIKVLESILFDSTEVPAPYLTEDPMRVEQHFAIKVEL